jgi:hypothetical protein
MADPVLSAHADKVSYIYDFLQGNDPTFLLIIGPGASGKSHALNEALAKMRSNNIPYNIMFWNDNETPGVIRHGSSDHMLWVIVKRSEDELAMMIKNEWQESSTVYFSAQA